MHLQQKNERIEHNSIFFSFSNLLSEFDLEHVHSLEQWTSKCINVPDSYAQNSFAPPFHKDKPPFTAMHKAFVKTCDSAECTLRVFKWWTLENASTDVSLYPSCEIIAFVNSKSVENAMVARARVRKDVRSS